MRKRTFLTVMLVFVGIAALTGCQPAPEATQGEGIAHAENTVGERIQELLEDENKKEATEAGTRVNVLIGSGENGIRINALLPDVPQKVYQMTLAVSDLLRKDTLTKLLDSRTGNVRDVTQEYLEENQRQAAEMPEGESFSISSFGDDTFLVLTDGEREASVWGNTTVTFTDLEWKKQCEEIYKSAEETVVTGEGKEQQGFTKSLAEQMLLEKLAVVGIREAEIYEVIRFESSGFRFYELQFVPSFEGIGTAWEFGQICSGEAFPQGTAWVTDDGVAQMYLENFCGRITRQLTAENILDFSLVQSLLEGYLESKKLLGTTEIALTQIDFVYYPVLSEDGKELELTPVWHIYLPLSEMLEAGKAEAFGERGAAWNIYINAITGELEKVE